MNILHRIGIWLDNAEWWHFWNPGSGFFGVALLMALVVIFILSIIL
jgi:hypothetical protein